MPREEGGRKLETLITDKTGTIAGSNSQRGEISSKTRTELASGNPQGWIMVFH